MKSLARVIPIRRRARWVPPLPGIMPSRTSGTWNPDRTVAPRKSQASASSRPAPIVYPSLAAMTGFRQRSAEVRESTHCSRSAGASVRSPATSPPALNALPPAPRTTMTRIASAASRSAKMPGNSWRMATVIVFILAWRSIQTVATGGFRSTLRNELITSSPFARSAGRSRGRTIHSGAPRARVACGSAAALRLRTAILAQEPAQNLRRAVVVDEDARAEGLQAGLRERGQHRRARIGELLHGRDVGRRELRRVDEIVEERGDQVEGGEPLGGDPPEGAGGRPARLTDEASVDRHHAGEGVDA